VTRAVEHEVLEAVCSESSAPGFTVIYRVMVAGESVLVLVSIDTETKMPPSAGVLEGISLLEIGGPHVKIVLDEATVSLLSLVPVKAEEYVLVVSRGCADTAEVTGFVKKVNVDVVELRSDMVNVKVLTSELEPDVAIMVLASVDVVPDGMVDVGTSSLEVETELVVKDNVPIDEMTEG